MADGHDGYGKGGNWGGVLAATVALLIWGAFSIVAGLGILHSVSQ